MKFGTEFFYLHFPISIVKEVMNKGSAGEKYLEMLTSYMLKVEHKQEEIS